MSESSDKTEPASEYKLTEAKKKGNVWKSMDVISVGMISGALILYGNTVFSLIENSKGIFSQAFGGASNILGRNDLYSLISDICLMAFSSIAFPFIIIAGVAAASSLLQTGFIFSFEVLKPNWERLNPVKGAKKLFSMQKLYELAKTAIKLTIISLIIIGFISSSFKNILALSHTSPLNHPKLIVEMVQELTVLILLPLASIAILDLVQSKRKYMNEQKMSKHEVKEEHKRREGDSQVKSKRKEIAEELKKRGKTLASVSDADVIITNPTHLAIVLKYDEAEMMAPKVMGKGADEFALKVIERAHNLGVPVIQNIPLARALYQQSIDSYINADSYEKVAAVYKNLK
ncbi:MAG: EscU/YscU/HrcU family type III secretion system export apparatus switch protein [Cycloclasticus sp.]|jgi:Flagellar biosynthesis pathway, component FlhB